MPANAPTSFAQAPPLPSQPWNRPIFGHLYTNDWQNGANNAGVFKKLVGPITRTPTFKHTALGSQQPVVVYLPTQDYSSNGQLIVEGDILMLTEQDGDGTIVCGGLVTDIGDTIGDQGGPTFPVQISPLSTEAALYPFETNYTTATDIAQMVRDAFANTKHLKATTSSCPNTGILGKYDFSFTGTPFAVVDQAVKMSGGGYQWHIDVLGNVWFGQASSASLMYTVKRGQDFTKRTIAKPIDKRYNFFCVIGGTPPGQGTNHPAAIACVYDAGHIIPCTSLTIPAPNYAKSDPLGVRARMPHYRVPKLLDQTTLNNITQAIGQNINRPISKIQLTLPFFSQRISIASVNGAAMRYWEDASNDGLLIGEAGSGGYSPTYLITDVEVAGGVQTVILTDLVEDDSDVDYWLQQMSDNSSIADATAITTDSVGVVSPWNIVGATGGGPIKPTTPALFP